MLCKTTSECEIGIGQNLLDVLGYDGLTSEYEYTIIKLVRCECLRKQAFAGRFTQQLDNASRRRD
jgi:hypothetical protein